MEQKLHFTIMLYFTISFLVGSVMSAEDGQIYRFDRNGFHVRTTDIMTGNILYNFTMYPANSLNGALVGVAGRGGQNLSK